MVYRLVPKFFFIVALGLVLLIAAKEILSYGNSPTSRPTEKTLTIVVGQHYPPYVFDQSEAGIDTQLIKRGFATQGIDVQFQHVPLIQVRLNIHEQADCTANAIPARGGDFYYSIPYIAYNNMAISLKSRQLTINRQADLLPYHVSAFQSAKDSLGKEWESLYKKVKKYREYNDQKYQLQQLLKGSHDVMINDVNIAKYLYRIIAPGKNFSETFTVHEIFSKTYYTLACRKEADILSFNRGVEQLRASNVYKNLHKQFNVDF